MSKNKYIRVYIKPTAVTFCLNCPGVERVGETMPVQFKCNEIKDEVKFINIEEVFTQDPFPDFCPLQKMKREKFKSEMR